MFHIQNRLLMQSNISIPPAISTLEIPTLSKYSPFPCALSYTIAVIRGITFKEQCQKRGWRMPSQRCPCWPSTHFNHTCMCACVFSRNRPSSCITDPRWICCSWTGQLFWPRTAQRTIYAETINATHTKHTPIPPVSPKTSQQTTSINSLNATHLTAKPNSCRCSFYS